MPPFPVEMGVGVGVYLGVIVGVTVGVISTFLTLGKKPERRPFMPFENLWLVKRRIITMTMARSARITLVDIEVL